MKIVIPVAGVGSRLRPHTHSRPKPLLEVAGQPILDFIVNESLQLRPSEVIFVVGHKKEMIQDHIKEQFPDLPVSFVEQVQRDGDGSALRLALDSIEDDEELFVIFGDTMVDFTYRELLNKKGDADALVLGMRVSDPGHYGIVETNEQGEILNVEEKPENPRSNLAIIGAYYFRSLLQVKSILERLYDQKKTIKGEYKIAQVIETCIKMKEVRISAVEVKNWFDCGRPEVLLAANRYFLSKFCQGKTVMRGDSIIISPSYVSTSATLERSVIGPYASIGADVVVRNSQVSNSIISKGSHIDAVLLDESLLSREVRLSGRLRKVNAGDQTIISLD